MKRSAIRSSFRRARDRAVNVDRAPGVPVKARVEQSLGFLQLGPSSECQLHHLLVGLARTDDPPLSPVERPDRRSPPLPLLDDSRVGLADERADLGQHLPSPIPPLPPAPRFVGRSVRRHACLRLSHASSSVTSEYRNAKDDVNPAKNRTFDALVHDVPSLFFDADVIAARRQLSSLKPKSSIPTQ